MYIYFFFFLGIASPKFFNFYVGFCLCKSLKNDELFCKDSLYIGRDILVQLEASSGQFV